MEQIYFSVVIPTYNRCGFLEKAVRSVLEQTFANLELIIIDDGSTDETCRMVESIKDDRIRYLRTKHRGPSHARNRGIELSCGDFIAFLDSDDRWTEKKLEITARYIKDFPEIKIFHTEEIWINHGRVMKQKKKHKKPDGNVYVSAVRICCVSISTAVIERNIFSSIGLFDESFPACEDYDFWLRATCEFSVKLIPHELTVKDGGRVDQLSASVWGLDRFRIKAIEKMLGSGKLPKKARRITFDELERKCKIFAKGAEKRGKSERCRQYLKIPSKYRG